MGLARSARMFRCRGQPGGLVTFFKRLKKVNQRKPPLSTAPSGFPALRAEPGGCGTRALRSDSPRRLPPARLCCSAVDQGDRKNKNRTSPPSPPRRGGHPKHGLRPQDPNPPLHRLGFPGESGAVGCVCLRPKAEFNAAARFTRKTEGSPKGRCGGVSFCLVTCILDKQNKVTCCRAAPGI
jgi:hypothetical protein